MPSRNLKVSRASPQMDFLLPGQLPIRRTNTLLSSLIYIFNVVFKTAIPLFFSPSMHNMDYILVIYSNRYGKMLQVTNVLIKKPNMFVSETTEYLVKVITFHIST